MKLRNSHLAPTENPEAEKALQYFTNNNFESSQVISINYDEEKQMFSLTVRYAMTPEFCQWLETNKKPDSPVSDFRLLEFRGVQDLQIHGIWLGKPGGEIYSLENSGVYLIDSIELKQETDLNIRIDFTSSSNIAFSFKEFRTAQKFSHGVKGRREDEWIYFDDESSELLDFFAPFERPGKS